MNKHDLPPQVAVMANSLYHSLKGQYFVGYADNMFFENGNNAWAALVNPDGSGVNLFVNVWTVTTLFEPPIRLQIWFNAKLPGCPAESCIVTTSNFTEKPLPKSKIKLMQASNVAGAPDGTKGYSRRAAPGETLVGEEDGKFIIPPGGNFALYLSANESSERISDVRIAFGWWEANARPCQDVGLTEAL